MVLINRVPTLLKYCQINVRRADLVDGKLTKDAARSILNRRRGADLTSLALSFTRGKDLPMCSIPAKVRPTDLAALETPEGAETLTRIGGRRGGQEEPVTVSLDELFKKAGRHLRQCTNLETEGVRTIYDLIDLSKLEYFATSVVGGAKALTLALGEINLRPLFLALKKADSRQKMLEALSEKQKGALFSRLASPKEREVFVASLKDVDQLHLFRSLQGMNQANVFLALSEERKAWLFPMINEQEQKLVVSLIGEWRLKLLALLEEPGQMALLKALHPDDRLQLARHLEKNYPEFYRGTYLKLVLGQ